MEERIEILEKAVDNLLYVCIEQQNAITHMLKRQNICVDMLESQQKINNEFFTYLKALRREIQKEES